MSVVLRYTDGELYHINITLLVFERNKGFVTRLPSLLLDKE